ncbi:MAG: HPr family phosphocarrier protein [Lachnospiraceae bacterium]|nr:HPr family phosphocarrier protein [Lachnospiraceae bacterium]
MMEFQILLDSPKEVEEFVKAASKCPFEIDLKSGNVFIDAKSFLGVMTMALHRKMDVSCIDVCDRSAYRQLKKFAVA